jgi:predicted O-methyltransferase YrrM
VKNARRRVLLSTVAAMLLVSCSSFAIFAGTADSVGVDIRVEKVLDSDRWGRSGMNVPAVDGQTLHDIIIENKYTRALEIGTSTGHSAIWLAWALSKTGGKLITSEIDEGRYREALKNFEEAGLSEVIDAMLGDAHEIVPALEGPFDFVFADADKDWNKNYLDAVLPHLEVGGCYTVHNVSMRARGRYGGAGEFVDYLLGLPDLETTFDDRRGPFDQLQEVRLSAWAKRVLE